MELHKPDIDAIFLAAIEISNEKMSVYLDEACGDDTELRARIEQLLDAQSKVASFLEAPAPELMATATELPPMIESVGSKIGPYKLREVLGDGGMGVVFAAEQEEPVRRKVALKVIKPGMDTREVISRFEAERQALAMMDHQNIARVLDAGATETGKPYFVMELVRGVTITEYCDKNKLSIRQRLDLFIQVCRAVQHAHQKGIIHRDIKPSNVMITLHDGVPVPKVIDFGVAKAINQRLTEGTVYTKVTQMVGTPVYMSPEQAELSGLDVDTRSDIYSLGVMLYELLTGSTPFTEEELSEVSFDEMRRIIRETDPERPSDRISTLKAEAISTVALQRGDDRRRLTLALRGELDWIVLKTLEKDRTRRYETANGLAADVQRYLDDEPVVACPPSVTYRFRKFARRNKAALMISSLLVLGLILGVVGLSVSNYLIAQSEADKQAALNQSDANLKQAITNLQLAQESEKRAQANFNLARKAVDQFLTVISEEPLFETPGMMPFQIELSKLALEYYLEFTEQVTDDPALNQELAAAHHKIGKIYEDLGALGKSYEALQKGLDLRKQLVIDHPDEPDYQYDLVESYMERCDSSDRKLLAHVREKFLENALRISQKLVADHPSNESYVLMLAKVHFETGDRWGFEKDVVEAISSYRKSKSVCQQMLETSPNSTSALYGLAISLVRLGAIQRSEGNTEDAFSSFNEAQRILLGLIENEPNSPTFNGWLAAVYMGISKTQKDLGQYDLAIESLEKAIQLDQELTRRYPKVAWRQEWLVRGYTALASIYAITGPESKSLALRQQALVSQKTIVDILLETNPSNVVDRKNLAGNRVILSRMLAAEDRYDEVLVQAIPAFEMWRELFKETSEDFYNFLECHFLITDALAATSQEAEVEHQTNKVIQTLRSAADEFADDDRLNKSIAWRLTQPPTSKVCFGSRELMELAVELAEKAVAVQPTNYGYWEILGGAYYRAADYQASIDTLNKAIQFWDPSIDPDGHLFLVMAQWQLGNHQQARSTYDQALKTLDGRRGSHVTIGLCAEAAELLGVQTEGTDSKDNENDDIRQTADDLPPTPVKKQ